MRRPGRSARLSARLSALALLGGWIACSGPPDTLAPETEPRAEANALDDGGQGPVEIVEDVPEPRGRAPDPLLARARAQMRGGQVPDELRRRLLSSQDADHRHATRLLQAVAGEKPEAVIARVYEPDTGPPIMAEAVLEVEPKPSPEPKPDQPRPTASELDDESLDPVPKLTRLPLGSPVREWFESGSTQAVAVAKPEPDRLVEIQRLFGPGRRPFLLEHPPIPDGSVRRPNQGPRLVILTSLSLRPAPAGDALTLTLVGAGTITVSVQPLDSSHLRLSIAGAGAVPSFLTARPARPQLEIVDISRRGPIVDLEVELAPGWSLRGVTPLDNGASLRFEGRGPVGAGSGGSR